MKKFKLTKKEKEELAGNEEATKNVLLNKAVLAEAEKYEFSEDEKKELEYIFNNEKSRYFLAKKIENKINIDDEEVTRIYTENKPQFDQQNIAFSDARDLIRNDILNAQAAQLENTELTNIIEGLEQTIEISKDDIIFSKGNPDVIKSILMNKVVDIEIEKENFVKEAYKELEIINNNVKMNYYIDLQIRKNVSVTQQEVESLYEQEKAKLGNITPNDAYNQIANGLLNNKANEERARIINKISEEYSLDEQVKENL